MKNDDQSSCREDGQSQSDADLSKMFVNDGLLVDLSLKLSALRLPMKNGEQQRPGKIDNCVKSKRPSVIYRAEENLENFLRGLSKDELCHYLVELLLDCQNKVLQVGHNQPAESERMRVRNGRRMAMSCLPGIFKDKPPGNTKRKRQHGHVASANEADPVPQEMNNCHHCKSKCDRQVNSANLKRDKATATSDAGNSLDQDSYHQAVLKAIDTLCDLRSLFEGRHSAGIKNNEIVEPMNETGAESDVRQHLW
ncbi:Hypothetical protein NTJ_00328 [Nesidiocoris tenuis]|uniref:Uncharacterized protein n=1 Tax=Nesidiocoris tenuis TaxID=355587 RepID=A0ABN7A5N5_9HEMI|nr:Hypothetical protein NTJ_00328 [Nesidiocoris tenuis]